MCPWQRQHRTRSKDLTFYVVTHGAASDSYWVIVNDAAVQAGADLGVEVNVSFAQNDIAAQKEAFNAAIAAGADGIAVSSPETGAFVEETQAALAAGIPVVYLDTDDVTSGRLAYVGANLFTLGTTWASYLVDNGFVTEGDFVWMPVEVPGAAYQVLATEGISSIFDHLGITYEVFDANYDPAQSLSNMTDYLTSNKDDVDAIIGLGDLVMTNIKPAFDAAGIEKGSIPVVGWGSTNRRPTRSRKATSTLPSGPIRMPQGTTRSFCSTRLRPVSPSATTSPRRPCTTPRRLTRTSR